MISESRLLQTFLELVAIDSPSGQEETISKELARRFGQLGAEVEHDEHWNLIARVPATGNHDTWLMLSAHMDTVGKDVGIRPVIRDGVIYSDGTTILGGDDKSGVAAILEVIRSLKEDGTPHPPLEAVISVSEEVSLSGARWLDKSKLRSKQGYVLDAGGPIGTIITNAPSQDTLEVWVHGKTAHAGNEPEKGINAIVVASTAIAAMPLGRIDFETTANIGIIQGGVATNIVPDQVYIKGEARSRDDTKLAVQVTAMVDAFESAAERYGARVEVKIKRAYSSFKLADDHPVVAAAADAARRLGYEPIIKGTGGGSDANIYAEHGIACAILSTGMADVHTPQEHIAIADMVAAARLLQEIVAG
ncbi:MAG: M20/M25/M40 family metallo-hydrolase [Anaerolineae bacterium]